MSLFGFWRPARHKSAPGFVAGERILWFENTSETDLRIMLEPWCEIVDVPPGQYARLSANFTDDYDEFFVQYSSDSYLGVYCPPYATITVVEKR